MLRVCLLGGYSTLYHLTEKVDNLYINLLMSTYGQYRFSKMVQFKEFTKIWSFPTKYLRELMLFQTAIFHPERPRQFLSIRTDLSEPELLLCSKVR